MTTEIAIMNRRALVLAADSAGTVTSWVNGRQETRFFKGENKVFQLVTGKPIGLMTFGNAHVMHVPWDVVVKEFRRSTKTGPQATVQAYAEMFFAEIEQDHLVFPSDQREADFKSQVGQQIVRVVIEAFNAGHITDLNSLEDKRVAFLDQISARETELATRPLHPPFTVGDIDKALADIGGDATEACQGMLGDLWPVVEGYEDRVFGTAVNLVYRTPADVASSTGIVIGGFGEAGVFPSIHQFRVYGFIREKLLYESVSETSIGPEKHGDIQSYASNSMVETFTHGMNGETYGRVTAAYEASVTDLLDGFEMESGTPIADKPSRISASTDAFTQRYITDLAGLHSTPLVNVVSMLAIDEMANLAETLISLESLKEKVTRPTESVGGPVDVAAITKAEGLVWIKRKHYFDLTTNPRYAAKLAHTGGGGYA